LDEDLRHLAFVVYGTPHIELLSGDPDDHLVEMSSRTWLLPKPSQTACDLRPEFQHPPANRLIAHLDATLGHEILDIAVAQREPKIRPNGVLDDCRWELVALV